MKPTPPEEDDQGIEDRFGQRRNGGHLSLPPSSSIIHSDRVIDYLVIIMIPYIFI